MTWTHVRGRDAPLQRRGHPARLRDPAPAGPPAAQPAGLHRAVARPVVEHGRQLRDEHELAELRRRDDAELPHADARARGAELRLRGVGHGGARRAHPRLRAQDDDDASATSGSISCAARSTSCCRSSIVCALVLVSQGVVQTFQRVPRPCRSSRPTKDADGKAVTDQVHRARARPRRRSPSRCSARTAAGSSTRTPRTRSRTRTPLTNFLDMCGAPRHPRGAHLHLRQDGEGHAPGLGAARGDVRRPRAAALSCASPRSRRATPRFASLARRPGGERAAGRRQHGGQGSALRHLGIGLFATRPRPPSRAAPSTRCTTRSRRSAVSCRCGSSSSARSSSAASAPASTACSMFAIVAVFVAGLMVGRTPEYLGKKIEAYEMKMASLVDPRPARRRCSSSRRSPSSTEAGQEGASQPRAARLQRDPLRVLVGGEQQRQRVRRPDAANTPFYNTTPRRRDVLRALLHQDPGARARRSLASKKIVPDERRERCRRTRRSSSRMLVGRDHHRRRADLHPGARARAHRRAAARAIVRSEDPMNTNKLGAKRSRLGGEPSPGASLSSTDAGARRRGSGGRSRRAASTARAARRARSSSRPSCAARSSTRSASSTRVTRCGTRHVRRRGRQRPHDGALHPGARRSRARRRPGFILAISLWLWFTVLFANFAEAMAEGRGKAQADSLRKARKDIQAKQLSEPRRDAAPSPSLASQLRKGDLVLVEAGDFIPGDGEIVEGVASVDESAITGESAPVIRESGGDRSAVTGGTRVLSDWLVVRITANPGETFLDRMIAMVEGRQAPEDAERDRARHPARRADDHLPARDRHAPALLALQRATRRARARRSRSPCSWRCSCASSRRRSAGCSRRSASPAWTA